MTEQFKNIYAKITRPGADKLLQWLEGSSDFFTAPASTKYHLSRLGGLVEHSVHVYDRLRRLYTEEYGDNPIMEECLAIVGLLHDVCKANFYSVEMRNRKNAQGVWEQYPFYIVNDQIPYGHGEKSVYIISNFMRLDRREAMAIRWHMGPYEAESNAGRLALSAAFQKYPLALLTHLADMQATYLDEIEEEQP